MPRLTEDKMVTKTLLQHFALEAEFEGGSGQYYALMLRDNGDLMAHHPFSPGLDPAQLMFAADVLRLLNRELHHDGAWVICFTHPKPQALKSGIHLPSTHWEFGRYALTWLDADGDPQFTQEWMEGSSSERRDFVSVLLQGIVPVAQMAEAAWQAAHEMTGVLELKPEQTFKQAQGQRAPSLH